jgi:hypothetical protein
MNAKKVNSALAELKNLRATVEGTPSNGRTEIVMLKQDILQRISSLEAKLQQRAKPKASPNHFDRLASAIHNYRGGEV